MKLGQILRERQESSYDVYPKNVTKMLQSFLEGWPDSKFKCSHDMIYIKKNKFHILDIFKENQKNYCRYL